MTNTTISTKSDCEAVSFELYILKNRNWFSKDRITINDNFCFKSPITKPGHFRLVFICGTFYSTCLWCSCESAAQQIFTSSIASKYNTLRQLKF